MFKSILRNVQIFVTKCSNLGCKNSSFYIIRASNIIFYAKNFVFFSTIMNIKREFTSISEKATLALRSFFWRLKVAFIFSACLCGIIEHHEPNGLLHQHSFRCSLPIANKNYLLQKLCIWHVCHCPLRLYNIHHKHSHNPLLNHL